MYWFWAILYETIVFLLDIVIMIPLGVTTDVHFNQIKKKKFHKKISQKCKHM